MAVEKRAKAPRRRGRKGSEKHGKASHSQKRRNDGDSRSPAAKNRQHTTLLIQLNEDTPNWYSCGRQTPGRNDTVTSHPPTTSKGSMSRDSVAEFRAQADELYTREVFNFRNNNNSSSSSDDQWVENTMKRGTLKDRIAAMSVIVSTNPVHKLHALDGLLSMAANPNARMAQMAAEALEDLFLRTLLPPNRKLYSLEQRPLYLYKDGAKTLSPRILLLWRYEELLKEKYQTFLSQYLLHTLSNGMDINKLAALRTASMLLREVPEGEAQLLSMLVNKLGDPSKKIAAAAGHQLRQVLEQHVNMQVVVAREVQQLAHRPHLSPRALYNCIIFLNQLQLTAEDTSTTAVSKETGKSTNNKVPKTLSLPASLVQTYFRLFEVAVKNNSEIKSRLLSALLTGVNRAHPYLPEQDKDLEQHVDSLYRVVHSGPPSASTQALMLLFHVAVGSHEQDAAADDSTKPTSKQVQARQDRFYRALYATLSQLSMVAGGKHLTMYFNLLYKAMKHDTNTTRVISFAKRLLSTTMHTSPPVTAASLFLLSEVMKTQEALKSCFVDIAEGDSAMAVLDASKREPMAALIHGGESVAYAHLWESTLLQSHYHPSVSKFASGNIEYTGDPLRDFSLAPFLDKFAYRNPKSNAKGGNRGESVAERRTKEKETTLPLNDPSFLEKEQVDEQEEFFHKFFVERARRDEKKGIVRDRDQDDDDGEDEAFDIAEKFNTDQTFEEAWETDSEEEAFVDSLAEKLIEDAANVDVDLDDEDPDMEGWDDMYDDEGGDDDDSADDEDAFMDKMDDMSDDSDEEPQFDGDDDNGVNFQDDDFMDASDSSDDSDSDDVRIDSTSRETTSPTANIEDDESSNDQSNDFDLAFLNGSDSDSDDDDAEPPSRHNAKQRKSNRKQDGDSDGNTFADASAYEELINKGWREMQTKRSANTEKDEIGAEATSTAANPSSNDRKRKRRSKKKRRTS